jgi:hypothetical protein
MDGNSKGVIVFEYRNEMVGEVGTKDGHLELSRG